MTVAIVFTGGDPPDSWVLAGLPTEAFVVAADSGVVHAAAAHRPVDLVVGDLDSAPDEAIAAAEADGARVERHDISKDDTDLGLALDAAAAEGVDHIVVVGGAGGRLDHLFANVSALTLPRYASIEITALLGSATVTVVRGSRTLRGPLGDYVSLFAMGGPAHGVVTSGLLFPLRNETLLPGSTRGVSNELVRPEARVRVADGVVVAIQPGEVGSLHRRSADD